MKSEMFRKDERMAKKKIIFCLIFPLLFATFSHAIDLGVGLYGGKDFYSISNISRGFNLMDLTEASISRRGFSNPWLFAISLYFNMNGNWRIRFSGDLVMVKYKVLYSRTEPTIYNPFYVRTSTYKIKWGRMAIWGSLEKYWQISDRISFFADGGGGLFVLAPVVSDKFIMNTLLNKFMELDVSKDIDMSYKFGGLASLGMEAVLLKDKIHFRIEGRYNIMLAGRYEEPTNFLSLESGFIFRFKI